MKSLAATPLLLIALATPALAQNPATDAKSVKTIPIRPDGSVGAPKAGATQSPADAAKALAQTERTAIQSDLAWVGVYNGNINGEVSDRMVAAIKAFQKNQGGKETGTLNPQERAKLAEAAKKLQNDVGWKVAQDPINGIRLGVPTKLVPQMSSMANTTGSKWTSQSGQVQIETWRLRDADQTIAKVAEQQKNDPAGRKVDYSVVRPDFFVLSGLQGAKKFYVRGQIKGGEVRGLTILYDQATEGRMVPVVIAMSSAFTPFPANAQADAPPPRKKVEYATGIVVSSDGAIITDRQAVDGCQFIVVPGHGNADRVAEDKAHDLVLLRIYGARDLKPIAIGSTAAKANVVLTGIADPQNQGGAAAVSNSNATLQATTLSPAPGIGFAGAAAVDSDGVFAGMTLLKPAVVAGTPSGGNDAVLVPANQVLAFLKAHDVTPASGQKADAKAAVVRVVCVRK
jgi:peptidoglycan hydrolase-like protein with peptidoglycan-binding domain